MTTENIIIQIREDGTRVVIRNVREIGEAAKKSEDGINSLKRALGALAGALAFNQIREWMDIWTRATGLVNIFTKSLAETNLVMEKLYQIAQDTRQPINDVVKTFHQMSVSARALGASQNQLLAVTELVGKAFAIQGTPTNVAKAGLLQLGHAFSEGLVRGRQFNSLLIEMPRVLEIAAKHIEGANGSLAKLRQMMLSRELTSKALFDALVKGSKELDELFDRSGKTMSQAFTIGENAIIRYIGETDKAYGISQKFFDLFKFGANNINDLAKGFTILASPFIVLGIIKLAEALYGASKAMMAFAVANPFTAALLALTTLVTALTLYRDQIIINQQEQITLGDYMRATWQMAKEFASDAIIWIADIWNDKTNIIAIGFTLIIRSLKAVINEAIGLTIGLYDSMIAIFNKLPAALGDLFFKGMNYAVEAVENGLNRIVNGFNAIAAFAGVDQIANIQLGRISNTFEGKASELGTDVKKAFESALSIDYISNAIDKATGTVSLAFNSLNERAQKFAIARREEARKQALERAAASGGMDTLGEGEDFSHGDNKAVNKLENQLRALLNRIEPARGALLEMAKAEDVLNKSVSKGLINTAEKSHYLNVLKLHYQDIIDPMGAYFRELNKEIDYLKLNNKERLIEETVNKEVMSLRKKGIVLTETEISKIRESNIALHEAKAVAQERQSIYDQTIGLQEKYNNSIKASTQLFDQGSLSAQQYNKAVREIRIALLEGKDDFDSGIERGFLKIQRDFEDTANAAEKFVGGFFGRFNTVIDDFVDHGKLSFGDFFSGILRDLAKMEIKFLLFGKNINGVFNPGLFSGASGGLLNLVMGGSQTNNVAGAPSSGNSSQVGNLLSIGSTLWKGFSGGLTSNIGGLVTSAGNLFGSTAVSSLGAGIMGAGGTLVGTAGAGLGATVAGSATGIGAAATTAGSLGATIGAAIPYVAIAAIAYTVLSKIFSGAGPELHSGVTLRSNNSQGNTEVNNRDNEGNLTARYLDNRSIEGAFGSFGISASNWTTAFARDSAKTNEFLTSVKATDDLLASHLTTLEKAQVVSYINQRAITVDAGPEGSDMTNAYSAALVTRLKDILEGVQTGLSSFVTTIGMTTQQIVDDANALLAIRKMLASSGTDIFGTVVTIQQLAALRTGSETVAQALNRVTNEFILTNQIATMLGKTAEQAFGAIGLASLAARERLIVAAGGMEALANGSEFFAKNFFTAAEQMKPIIDAVTAKMASLGLSGVTTVEQFKKAAMAIDLHTQAGADQFAAMIKIAPEFKQVVDYTNSLTGAMDALGNAVKSATDILNERKELQSQLDALTLTENQLLAKKRLTYDESNRSLFDQIVAAQAAKTASEEATKAFKEAADAQRELALDRRKLELEWMELSGNSSGALQGRRQDELNTMNETLRPLQNRINRLRDAKEAEEKAIDAVAKARDVLSRAYTKESTALKDLIQRFGEIAKSLRQFSQSLLIGDLSNGSPETKYFDAKNEFDKTYSLAKSGDPEAMSRLESVSQTFLEISRAYYGSTQLYSNDFDTVRRALESTASIADSQVSIAQSQLTALDLAVSNLISIDDGIVSVQLAITNLNTSILTLSRANAAVTAAGGIPNSTNQPARNLTVTDLYHQYLGRDPEQGGLDYWTRAFGTSIDAREISDFLRGAIPELTGRANGSFESGLSYVPYDGFMVKAHRGEGVLTAAQNAEYKSGSNEEIEQLCESIDDLVIAIKTGHVQVGQLGALQIERLDTIAVKLTENKKALRTVGQ